MRQLRVYANGVRDDVEEITEDVADELVSELRTDPTPELTGDYRKGWRAKRVGNKFIIHNATDYQLTHLLEKGHAKKGGGRVPAYPHIRPAEQRAIDEFLRKLEAVLGP
ncbi:HK97 gp10 family phage protein [Bacillus mesophilum]